MVHPWLDYREFWVHFRAMLKKNVILSLRSWKGTLSQLFAPILFLLIVTIVSKLPDDPVKNTPFNPMIPKCVQKEERRCFTLLYTTDGPMANSTNLINSSDIDQIMNQVALDNGLTYSLFDNSSTTGIDSVMKVSTFREFDLFIIDNPNVTQTAIIFNANNSFSDPSNSISYSILYNASSLVFGGETLVNEDASYIVASIQKSVDAAIVSVMMKNYKSVNVKSSIKTLLSHFPLTNGFGFNVQAFYRLGNFFLYCALMFNFTVILYQIVNEKFLKLRQGMLMVGLSSTAYWLSWFVIHIGFLLFSILVITIIGYASGFAFFMRTNYGVIFLALFTLGIAMFALAYLLSVFLNTARTALNAGMLIFVVGAILQIVFTFPDIIQLIYKDVDPLRWVLQFYPPYNFSKLMYHVNSKSNEINARQLPKGDKSLLFNWNDLYTREYEGGYSIPPAAHSFGYLMGDFALFIILAWYFSNVLERGAKPYFFLTKDYWGFESTNKQDRYMPQSDEKEDEDVSQHRKSTFDDETAELRVLDLHKKYGMPCTKQFHAVRGLSLSVRKGQVLSLLGHNGAGKTTTISCLTGAHKTTSGDAYLYGHSLKNEPSKIAKIIGVCPQHDLLYEELTPREHLEMFANIKGVPKGDINDMIEQRLADVLLTDVQNKPAGQFSGGMKRRLSVAISAMGDPKIIFLDEPTTGLDPVSRREIWNAIQRLKVGRVIVLTTHSMEEADILGNTIAVMAKGKLRCIGTSLHLKNKFGLGYRLNVTSNAQRQGELASFVAENLPGAELLAQTGESSVYGIKTKSISSSIPFFQLIESNKNNPDFIIKEWGISQTTLEEVFLSVTKASESEH